MKQKLFFFPLYIYILAVLYILSSYFVLTANDKFLQMTIHEDQYFEVIGALGLFMTSILFLIAFFLSRRIQSNASWFRIVPFFFLGLSILFLFGAGEEISWGQRLFRIDTPESLSSINRQAELNFHNLEFIDGGQFFSADRLFDIFWFTFTVALPFGYLLFPIFRELLDVRFSPITPIPHLSFGLLFLINYFWAKVVSIFFQDTFNYQPISFKQAVQEIKESNYSILFVLVGIYFILVLQKHLKTQNE